MQNEDSISALEKLRRLLEVERQEDKKFYREKMRQIEFKYRREKGVCWFPVRLQSDKFGIGGRVQIELGRTNDLGKPHLFQSGGVVSMFVVRGNGEEHIFADGVVSRLDGDMMRVMLNQDHLPNELIEGKIGVYVAFDERTYQDMDAAIQQVIRAENNRISELRELLLGQARPQFKPPNPSLELPNLNPSQNEAVRRIAAAQDIAIIHGPPGTGKTTTLVAAIVHTLKTEKQVLVCAPSNTAVDLLAEKLDQAGVTVTRMGHPARITERLIDITLDGRFEKEPDYKHYRELIKKSEQMRQQAYKFKKTFGRAEREKRKDMVAEARRIKQDAYELEDYIIYRICEGSQVIATTLTGAGSNMIRRRKFTTVFVDEAAQAIEGAAWIPLLRADRLVMAGDHQQLPPTIKSIEAAKAGLERSLFEKTIRKHPETAVMLKRQYRMHEKIMHFSNRMFYRNELEADEKNRLHQLSPTQNPIEWIDTAGCGFEEKRDPETLSRYNEGEADLLLKHLEMLLEQLSQSSDYEGKDLEKLSIGVIAPYKSQVKLLRERAKNYEHIKHFNDQISIHTVDGFQGQERDIMYICFVRSNEKGEIGFLSNTKRTNVAMTRARKKLVLVGDSATLSQHEFYEKLLAYIDDIEAYRSAWELGFAL
ncbi:MAG: AAA family ATPase [Bernardetiaceae bacterium]|nr:AAA family ATPase [Bernardetiaceae bacterium]